MSTRVSRAASHTSAGCDCQRRKMVLEVDLNVPPFENFNEVGTSSYAPPIFHQAQGGLQRSTPQFVPLIDVDSIDDDVVLCSPRAFAEAKHNSRRNQTRSTVVDIYQESTSRNAHCNKRQRVSTNQPIINCELYVIPERPCFGVSGNGKSIPGPSRRMAPPPPSPPPPPPLPAPEPTFSCPVCISPLVEEVTTKCGHIFCKACIKKSISTQAKCPTCRRKVTMKDIIRIYLPTTKYN